MPENRAGNHSPQLRTPRLLLRSLQRSDVPQLVVLAGAREVAATTLRIPHPYTSADAESFLAWTEDEQRNGRAAVFGITLAKTGELCGVTGLHMESEHAHAEMGFWIGVPHWGHGYCTEAARAVLRYGFEVLKLHRIYACHFKGNDASRRVLEKLAMRHEGSSRQHVRKWGRFVDLENYGILADEFGTARWKVESARSPGKPARGGKRIRKANAVNALPRSG